MIPRWQPGRQGTGYRKLLLASGKAWDLYVLDYPPGARVPIHTDKVEGKEHVRANVRLWGEDAFDVPFEHMPGFPSALRFWRLTVFRPDETPHQVLRVSRRRVVLSLGWVRP